MILPNPRSSSASATSASDSIRTASASSILGLALTGIYNVLEKLRSGEPLTATEKQIHDQGLVTVLRQIHDELDEGA